MSTEPVWECQHSVDADVPLSFAWHYMTDVSNWSDPPAEFALDGPFEAGSRGTTRIPGRPTNSWVIRHVDPGTGYTLEGGSFLEGTLLLFHWLFGAVSDSRTRLTQRIELRGERAAEHVHEIRNGFEPNLEPGMRRIAETMAQRFAQERRQQ